MKKIINGKMYDTEKADVIGIAQTEKTPGPVALENVTDIVLLYKKKDGEYFFLINCSDGYGNIGTAIIITPIDVVKLWAANCLSIDDYIKEFGEPEENILRIIDSNIDDSLDT